MKFEGGLSRKIFKIFIGYCNGDRRQCHFSLYLCGFCGYWFCLAGDKNFLKIFIFSIDKIEHIRYNIRRKIMERRLGMKVQDVRERREEMVDITKMAEVVDELYKDRRNRDKRARELKAKGYVVKKYSIRNQVLHPEYVKDWDGEYETGFGNLDYKTLHPVLYGVRAFE
ncbi:hypothetical protein DRJ19_02855 [Candidatus Woesearchaeota archaeon]|nr:MAG: hypothetical protein DRJ19_02855 [Candidatus Woesearchaeota archaeon]